MTRMGLSPIESGLLLFHFAQDLHLRWSFVITISIAASLTLINLFKLASRISSDMRYCNLLSFRFVSYLSTVCDNAVEGKKLLNAALNALFCKAVSSSSENSGVDDLCERTEGKPCLLWSALYIQDLTTVLHLTLPLLCHTVWFTVFNVCILLLVGIST